MLTTNNHVMNNVMFHIRKKKFLTFITGDTFKLNDIF